MKMMFHIRYIGRKEVNRQALCLSGLTQVRVPGATIALKHTICNNDSQVEM